MLPNKNLLPKPMDGLFSDDLLNEIHHQKWLKVWVPKSFNGLGASFAEGLKLLHDLAYVDGSLGWTVTLCSGANYFVGNLPFTTGQRIFKNKQICFGGSGMLGGTAEKNGDQYCINGLWHYATGSPYLSHFTLNAVITVNGEPLLDDNGDEQFRSFLLPKEAVTLIPSWKTMGLKATATHSFSVNNYMVNAENSFRYDIFYLNDVVYKIPFRVFADLTLLVNYIGMAKHFFVEASAYLSTSWVDEAHAIPEAALQQVLDFAEIIENKLKNNLEIDEALTASIHRFGEETVEKLSQSIIQLYPLLGIKAASENHGLNQIFQDYFTATQHRNFRKNI